MEKKRNAGVWEGEREKTMGDSDAGLSWSSVMGEDQSCNAAGSKTTLLRRAGIIGQKSPEWQGKRGRLRRRSKGQWKGGRRERFVYVKCKTLSQSVRVLPEMERNTSSRRFLYTPNVGGESEKKVPQEIAPI